jgi:hypothetical protein
MKLSRTNTQDIVGFHGDSQRPRKFSDGMASITLHGKEGYIDITGKVVIAAILNLEIRSTGVTLPHG